MVWNSSLARAAYDVDNGAQLAAAIKAPRHVFSDAGSILSAIPQANLTAAVNTLSPIAQIGARAKADRDLLAMEQAEARRTNRWRLAGQIFGSMDFGGGGGISDALTAFKPKDPRQELLGQLEFQRQLAGYLQGATSRSQGIATSGLSKLVA